MGDFIGHVGSSVNGYEEVYGGHGWREQNKDGERLLEFADSFDVVIRNTFSRKDAEKLTTYKFGGNVTVIDHVLIRKDLMKNLQDIKVNPGEECFSQHRLLIIVLKWQNETVTEKKTGGRVKLWRLNDEKIRKVVRQKIDEASTGCESWDN